MPPVLWVVPGPDAWDGPVVPQTLRGFEGAFRTRLGRVVGVARLVRWVERGAQQASGLDGPLIRMDSPWTLAIQVDDWGLRTGEAQVESFLDLELTLRDDGGKEVWHSDLSCVEPLLLAVEPGAMEVARALVALENDVLQRRYTDLADTCGERAWTTLMEASGRSRR